MKLFEIHIQFDLSGHLFQVVYAQEFSQKLQFKFRIDLHNGPWLGEVTHYKIALEYPLFRSCIDFHDMDLRSAKRMFNSIRIKAFESQLIYFFVCACIQEPRILTSK